MNTLNTLAAEIHADNVAAGWWDEWPVKTDRFKTAMMLVVTELAEAAEGARKGLMDDHLPHRKMFDVELADTMIRLLDLDGPIRCDLEYGMPSNVAFYTHEMRDMRNDLERLWFVIGEITHKGVSLAIRDGVHAILALAAFKDIPLFDIIEEKRAYNAQRADHKRENRAKAGGKKF